MTRDIHGILAQILSELIKQSDGTSTPDINLAEVLGAATNVGGGVIDTGTQTVVLADNDPAVVLLGTIDTDTGAMVTDLAAIEVLITASNVLLGTIDADTGNMATDLAAIELLLAFGSTAMTAAQSVTIATDDTILLPLYTTLNVAHDAVDAGNGFKQAGYATNVQVAAVAAGDRVNQVLSLNGETISRSHDYANAAEKVIEQSPIWAHRTSPEDLVTIASGDIDDEAWVWNDNNFGSVINCVGYTQLNIYLSIAVIGDATNIQIRALGSITGTLTAVDSYAFAIETVSASNVLVEDEYVELNVDAPQNVILKIRTEGVPYIQLQLRNDTNVSTATGTIIINKVWF